MRSILLQEGESLEKEFWKNLEGANCSRVQELVWGSCTGCKKCGTNTNNSSVIRLSLFCL